MNMTDAFFVALSQQDILISSMISIITLHVQNLRHETLNNPKLGHIDKRCSTVF